VLHLQGSLAGKSPAATRKQEEALQAAILAALRKRDGKAVIGEGSPAKWRLASTQITFVAPIWCRVSHQYAAANTQ
jgi:hypothetical protein